MCNMQKLICPKGRGKEGEAKTEEKGDHHDRESNNPPSIFTAAEEKKE